MALNLTVHTIKIFVGNKEDDLTDKQCESMSDEASEIMDDVESYIKERIKNSKYLAEKAQVDVRQ